MPLAARLESHVQCLQLEKAQLLKQMPKLWTHSWERKTRLDRTFVKCSFTADDKVSGDVTC